MPQLTGFRKVWIAVLTIIAVFVSVQIHSAGFSAQPVMAQENSAQQMPVALPDTAPDPAQYGSGLRRTRYRLANSTPDHPDPIRILFYGQSISKQEWWIEFVHTLQQQFPNASLIVENRAIGGFPSPVLVRTAEHDLYPFYPDLVVFQVYGDEENYQTIVTNTLRRTTAEVILASDHIDWLPTGAENENSEALRRYRWHNQHADWLKTLAAQYGCEFVDIRNAWRQYLESHDLPPSALLSDQIHLNAQGNHLMATLMTTHLLQSPVPVLDQLDNRVIEYRDLQWQNGELTLTFTGNRVDLITRPGATGQVAAAVLIDGKLPSHGPELYRVTRPSDAPGVDWPSILQIQSVSPLIAEDWTLMITAANAAMNQFRFDLYGSRTGFDGSGTSTEKFVSNSGRVVLEPQNWWLENAYQFTQKTIPVGFQIRWRVEPLFTDFYTVPAVQEFVQSRTITVAQNLTNISHTLKITALNSTEVPIEAIRVYQPSLR